MEWYMLSQYINSMTSHEFLVCLSQVKFFLMYSGIFLHSKMVWGIKNLLFNGFFKMPLLQSTYVILLKTIYEVVVLFRDFASYPFDTKFSVRLGSKTSETYSVVLTHHWYRLRISSASVYCIWNWFTVFYVQFSFIWYTICFVKIPGIRSV